MLFLKKRFRKSIYNLKLESGEVSLPKKCFFKLILQIKDNDINKLMNIILKCPLLTFLILRYANFPEFGFQGEIKLISEAITVLQPMVLLNYLLSFKESETKIDKYKLCNKIISGYVRIDNICKQKILNIFENKSCEEVRILYSLFHIIDILSFQYNIPQITLLFKNKNNETALLLKYNNFPEDYINFFYSPSNNDVYLKKFFLLTDKYYYLSMLEYHSFIFNYFLNKE